MPLFRDDLQFRLFKVAHRQCQLLVPSRVAGLLGGMFGLLSCVRSVLSELMYSFGVSQ